MPTTRRTLSILPLAALAALGCSDSTDPVETVPRQLYYITSYVPTSPYPSGVSRLFGVALDGSQPVQVIPDSIVAPLRLTEVFPPWISRDGKQIKVVAWPSDSGVALVTVDPFGTVLSKTPYPDSVPFYPRPALSPDGTTFAWFNAGYLITAPAAGGPQTKIYFDSLGPVLSETSWSRDGRSVAYLSYHTSQTTGAPQNIRLWTRRFSDGFARPIATLSSIPSNLSWSQDGRWLTFGSGGDIQRVRTDGSGPTQVVYDGGTIPAVSASWGPGDSLLAITRSASILVVRADGSGGRVVVTGSNLLYSAWRN